MSLINQMLQDLDARRAAESAGAHLPNDVRPLPAARPSRLPWVIVGLSVALASGGLGLYWNRAQKAVDLPAPAVAVPPAPPLPAMPPPPPVVAVPVPEPAGLPALPSVDPQPVAESSLKELGGSLRLADVIKLPTERKPAARAPSPQVAPEKGSAAERARPPENAQPPVNTALPAAPAESVASTQSKNSKPAVIEKTDPVGTPRERVETDYRKAIASANQGRINEAFDGLRSVLKQDAYHAGARQLLVKLLLEVRRTDEAMQILHDGLQGQPAQIGWATSLARLYVDRGDLANAWQTLNYSLPAAANSADYQGFSGHVLQRLGRNKEAAARYQAAARLSPADGRWWLGLGLAMEAEGQNTEAHEAFLRARQTNNLSAELMALVEQKLR